MQATAFAPDAETIGTAVDVVGELSDAMTRDVEEPGHLRQLIEANFGRFDSALGAAVAREACEHLRQFYLSVLVCLRAIKDGHELDMVSAMSWYEDAGANRVQ